MSLLDQGRTTDAIEQNDSNFHMRGLEWGTSPLHDAKRTEHPERLCLELPGQSHACASMTSLYAKRRTMLTKNIQKYGVGIESTRPVSLRN